MGAFQRTVKPWLWVGFGGLGCLAGVLMVASAPAVWIERRAYERAEPCEGVVHDCVRVVPAVVERTDVERRKADNYYVWLRVEDTPRAELVELPVPDVVFPALTPGREVHVRIWEDRIARIDVYGVGSAETERSPRVVGVEQPLAGFAVAMLGALAVWNGLAMRRGLSAAAMGGGTFAAVGRVLIALWMGALAGSLLVFALDVYFAPAWVSVTVVVAFGFWYFLRSRARSD